MKRDYHTSRFTFHVSRLINMSKRLVILILLLVGLFACAPQTTSGAQMAEANQLYETGQFVEAATAYQALVDAGVQDGTLYYNLGNAYFKAGDLGRAILNYRRAQVLLPRDSDVVANLQLARTQTTDRLETDDGGVLVSFVQRVLIEWTTLDEASAITLGLWVLLCILVVLTILWPRGRQGLYYVAAVVAVLLVLGMLSVGIRVSEMRGSAAAVVVAQSVEVRSGPGTDYLAEFSLHTGAEVRVLEQRDDWARIALPGDLQGWVPGETVKKLVP
ncbi:MAG: tetratricopeptide repeat protein [Chloroflexi bacterium]|nr:tetratricopeptide repeat protein [Chloroflexota bacterium]